MQAAPTPELKHLSLAEYPVLFSELSLLSDELLNGDYEAEFIGPNWLQSLAPKLLPLGGLAGWYGKSLKADGQAINLLKSKGNIVEKVPMCRAINTSSFDQNPALVLTYDRRAPVGCRMLIDELRSVNRDLLLGLTIVDLPLIRRFTLPFLLKRVK